MAAFITNISHVIFAQYFRQAHWLRRVSLYALPNTPCSIYDFGHSSKNDNQTT